MSSTPSTKPVRRHDLDALRAVAMLLGIALHAALSFAPDISAVWPVQDAAQSSSFSHLNALIHGFRMPLFFLISGYFTAMLWRSRGLPALIAQRANRIGIPLAVSLLTIVPVTWAAIIYAQSYRDSATARGDAPETSDLWTAAAANDTDQLEQLAQRGEDLDAQHPAHGSTPLVTAVALGNHASATWLLAHGADPNRRTRDEETPLHAAIFFGREACCRLLLEHDADPLATNARGSLTIDNAYADWGTTQFVANMVRVPVERSQVESGRKQIIDMLAERGVTRASASNTGSVRGALYGIYMFLTYFPFFHHLWFLWHLCWLVLLFAGYAWLSDRGIFPTLPRSLLLTSTVWLWLVPLTLIPQAWMGQMGSTFGPDTSSGLLPAPHVLCYYAIFFFVGAWYYDGNDQTGQWGASWWYTLPFSLAVLFPLGYELSTGVWGWREEVLAANLHRPIALTLQVVYTWLMIFSCMGLFRACFAHHVPRWRYLSDASYWLYLAHLPLVILAQLAVRDWQLPAMIKFVGVCLFVTTILLATYEYGVRYTWIGTLLNGPRRRTMSSDDEDLVPVEMAES